MAPLDVPVHPPSNITNEQLINKLGSRYVWNGTVDNVFCPKHNVLGTSVLCRSPVKNPHGGPDQTMTDRYVICANCLMEENIDQGRPLRRKF